MNTGKRREVAVFCDSFCVCVCVCVRVWRGLRERGECGGAISVVVHNGKKFRLQIEKIGETY